jgi:hypothetical protein
VLARPEIRLIRGPLGRNGLILRLQLRTSLGNQTGEQAAPKIHVRRVILAPGPYQFIPELGKLFAFTKRYMSTHSARTRVQELSATATAVFLPRWPKLRRRARETAVPK